MKIVKMRVNHLTKPIGYSYGGMCRFSWVTEGTSGKKQQAAQLILATDAGFNEISYDSKKSEQLNSLCHEVSIPLHPYTRYYWKLIVWTDAGEEIESETAYFETAKENEPWRYSWIAPGFDSGAHPFLRGDFTVNGQLKNARAYAAGLGVFEMEVNGEKCGDEYLLPGFHSYDSWIQYFTFDITNMLRPGSNTAGARLGNGWFNSPTIRGPESIYGSGFTFICEIRLEYEDGQVEYFGTDASWKSHPSEIVFSSLYDGETQDARLIVDDWCMASANLSKWSGVNLRGPENTGPLTARLSPPIICQSEIKPVELIMTPQNEMVLDFGQNMTGWVEFTCEAPEGTEILLQHGEILQDGCFYNANLRSAKAEYRYISDGKKRSVRPYFTFFGFRFLKVSGWVGELDLSCFKACVISSKTERTGHIKTSHALVNQLIENIIWGQRGNFLDVPTDCPQRDERLGWTGDAQVFCGAGCFNMDSAAFFNKYLADMRFEQLIFKGSIPHFVPYPKIKGEDLMAHSHGAAAWADAAVIIPWTLYVHYGDIALLKQHYPLMKGYVDFMISCDKDGENLYLLKTQLGDWLALDNFIDTEWKSCVGETDIYYAASAYFAYSSGLVSKAAAVLGYAADEEFYRKKSADIKKAIKNEYFTPSGRCAINTQTANVLALFMELVDGDFVPKAETALKNRLERRNMHLETGFIGTPYLNRVLTNYGMNEAAYTLLLNEDYPSWLYAVNMGATTIWERWNSVQPDGKVGDIYMNSLNHYAYGSIAEWMYRDMCGLSPAESEPGFKKIRFAPNPDPRFEWVSCTFDSAAGSYETSWKYGENGELNIFLTVPFDCLAEFVAPSGYTATKAENESGGAAKEGKFLDMGKWTIKCVKTD